MTKHRATLPGARAGTLVVRGSQPTNLAGPRESLPSSTGGRDNLDQHFREHSPVNPKLSDELREYLADQPRLVEIVRSWGVVILDAADEGLLDGWWLSLTGYKHSRRLRVERYVHSGGKRRESRSLAALIMPPPAGMVVDHINGDFFDNRRSNLRFATRQQNSWNQRSHKGSSSRFKGVSWRSDNKRWRAIISTADRKVKRLGDFLCEEDAARAYDAAAREIHGPFAATNFPTLGERCAALSVQPFHTQEIARA